MEGISQLLNVRSINFDQRARQFCALTNARNTLVEFADQGPIRSDDLHQGSQPLQEGWQDPTYQLIGVVAHHHRLQEGCQFSQRTVVAPMVSAITQSR